MTKHIIKFLRLQQETNKVQQRNVIDLNHYFKYSGKQELNNKLIEVTPLHRVFEKYIPVKNDMKKYKLKKYYSKN